MLRWNTTGITVAGNSGDPLNSPLDVIVNYANTLFIVDYGNNRAQKYLMGASNGTTIAGNTNGNAGASSNELHSPSRIIVGSDGDFYITDTDNDRIQFWLNGASVGTTVAGTGKDKN